ncbi:MAG: hypothetical protein A2452_02215 [Candidatus Firestonebacteria bacterium RIFOXYC2_FULL_39_67]|nr:MAG: hypothetical protein A2452_02215 [Candidatus Firestonebacteria bacterium RIFOXYC2_FULL_39_67]
MVKAVNMRSKRVLITGASGFIGSHIVNRIRKDNTVAVVMLNDEHSTRIEDSLGGIIRYNVDLKSTSDIMKVVADFKPDVILHLASIYAVNHKSEQIESLIETNVLGITNLLEASVAGKVKLFVNTSTCFVYDKSTRKIKENYQLKPLNLYGLTKINTEQLCDFYSDNYGLNCLTLRIFPPYGPNDNKRRLVPYVIDNCLSNNDIKLTSGIQKWDFVYVEDIVDAYILSLRAKIKGHEIINIGSGVATKVKDVTKLILKYAKSKSKLFFGSIPHRENEVWYCCADLLKAKRILGWRPKTSIASGIKKTVDWHIKNGGIKSE